MFLSENHGLEMSVSDLRQKLNFPDIESFIDVMVAARLLRKAAITRMVSFVHRRFNEYFIVARWLRRGDTPPLDSIASDSRFRDSLVLLVGVVDDDKAKEIAEFCWEEIRPLSDLSLGNVSETGRILRAVYSLRFLVEAFRARASCLRTFQEKLGEQISKMLTESNDLVLQKTTVEAAGLLDQKGAERILMEALLTGNRWLQVTAFRACRYLGDISPSMNHRLIEYLTSRSLLLILIPEQETRFLLSTSDIFSRAKLLLNIRAAEISCALCCSLVVVLFVAGLKGLIWVIAMTAIILLLDYVAPFVVSANKPSDAGSIFSRKRKTNLSEIVRNLESVERPAARFAEAFIWVLVMSSPLCVMFGLLVVAIVGVSMIYELEAIDVDKLINIVAFPSVILASVQEHGPSNSGLLVFAVELSNRIIELWKIYGVFLLVPFVVLCFVLLRSYPFYGYSIFAGKFSRFIRASVSIISYLVIFLFVAIIVDLAFYYLGTQIILISFGVLYAFGLILIGSRAVLLLRRYRLDLRNLRERTKFFSASRIRIAEDFNSFRTDRCRSQFVAWLAREAKDPKDLRDLSDLTGNPWPDGRRPNLGGDLASTQLAQLDARWLGLDV